MVEVVEETAAHLEVEEVHLSVVEEISNINTAILTHMVTLLATINQIMATNSTKHHSSIKLHLDPISTLHLAACKLRPTHNLNLNMDSQIYMLLDKVINHLTETSAMPTCYLVGNVHESNLLAARTEDIP